ncbi:unnamed protein product, partial [Heterotrigona itama]
MIGKREQASRISNRGKPDLLYSIYRFRRLQGKTSGSKEYLILRTSAMKAAANPQTIFREPVPLKIRC